MAKNRENNSLRKKLRSGDINIGSWITLADTATTEIMAQSGFDWLTIDMEHSAITLDKAQELIRVIELSDVAPLVRVGCNDANIIKRVMDAGAYGVIVPMVNTKDQAIKAVEAVKYPPKGKRGVGLARAQKYGLGFEEYKNWVNDNSIVIVQIEHIEAINNLEEILDNDDIDASIIGPYDLSASLGCPGDFKSKELQQAIDKYIKVCKDLGKSAGFHVIPPDASALNDKIGQGFSFVGFSLDSLFLGTKVQQELQNVKGRVK